MAKDKYIYNINLLAYKDNVVQVIASSETEAKRKAKSFIDLIADKDRWEGFDIEAVKQEQVGFYRKEK